MKRFDIPTRFRMWLGTALLAAVFAAPARADLMMFVQPVSVIPGSVANGLDVTVKNTGPAPVTIGGFSFGLSTANPDIVFTEANTSTALAAYIFEGQSLFGPVISAGAPVSGPQYVNASDLGWLGTTLGSGETAGLGHVLFDVSAEAVKGSYGLSLDAWPGTSFSDLGGGDIPFSVGDAGNIEVTPEPAFTWVAGLLMAGLGLAQYRRRRRALVAMRHHG